MEVLGRGGGLVTGNGAVRFGRGPTLANPYFTGCILQLMAGWLLLHLEQT